MPPSKFLTIHVPSTHIPYLILWQLTQDQEGGLVPLGAPLEHIHQISVGVVLDILPVHLQEDVPLGQLGAARVVHDQLHHWTQWRLTCRWKSIMVIT